MRDEALVLLLWPCEGEKSEAVNTKVEILRERGERRGTEARAKAGKERYKEDNSSNEPRGHRNTSNSLYEYWYFNENTVSGMQCAGNDAKEKTCVLLWNSPHLQDTEHIARRTQDT